MVLEAVKHSFKWSFDIALEVASGGGFRCMKPHEAEASMKCRRSSEGASTLQRHFTCHLASRTSHLCMVNSNFILNRLSIFNMLASDLPIPFHNDAPSPLPDPMPSASFGKRRIKKTEKAKALEDNSDSNGPGKKTKQWVEKAWVKKCMPCAKAIPEGDGDSEDSQNGDDDDIGGKIKYIFSLSHLAHRTNTCKSWLDASLTWALIPSGKRVDCGQAKYSNFD